MQIVPTILCDNISDFSKQWHTVSKINTPVQIDIADNTLTPSQTILPHQLGRISGPKIIFHLMIDAPDQYFEAINHHHPHKIIFHTDTNIDWSMWQKHFTKEQLGIALNPESSIDSIKPYSSFVSEVLIMTVHPGSIGQPMLRENLEKIIAIKQLYPDMIVSVDGGINESNIQSVAESMADIAYIGSAITRTTDPRRAYRALLKEVDEVKHRQ